MAQKTDICEAFGNFEPQIKGEPVALIFINADSSFNVNSYKHCFNGEIRHFSELGSSDTSGFGTRVKIKLDNLIATICASRDLNAPKKESDKNVENLQKSLGVLSTNLQNLAGSLQKIKSNA
jgi:hypothetical protein